MVSCESFLTIGFVLRPLYIRVDQRLWDRLSSKHFLSFENQDGSIRNHSEWFQNIQKDSEQFFFLDSERGKTNFKFHNQDLPFYGLEKLEGQSIVQWVVYQLEISWIHVLLAIEHWTPLDFSRNWIHMRRLDQTSVT